MGGGVLETVTAPEQLAVARDRRDPEHSQFVRDVGGVAERPLDSGVGDLILGAADGPAQAGPPASRT